MENKKSKYARAYTINSALNTANKNKNSEPGISYFMNAREELQQKFIKGPLLNIEELYPSSKWKINNN